MTWTPEEKNQKIIAAGKAFNPSAPIRAKDLFAGRLDQITAVLDTITQQGQHALIYGERGVGKTSLANVLEGFLKLRGQATIVAPHINCDSTDNYSSVWRKVFHDVLLIEQKQGFGFNPQVQEVVSLASDLAAETIAPANVLELATKIASTALFIPIIDEFDRLSDKNTTRQIADTIKALSDHVPRATLILVGVADTVEELIEEHASVERALIQIRMPRMSQDELKEIIKIGTTSLSMSANAEAVEYVASLSKGLPHYAHLLGLHATREAIDKDCVEIGVDHIQTAITKAISGAQQTLSRAYHSATMSPRRDALYPQALLAAALVRTDALGYFAAADLREPMSRIMGRPCDISTFAQHLKKFCDSDRGNVLERTGVKRRYRFRFKNPLLQPFVIMQGLAKGFIKQDAITLGARNQ